MMVLRESCERKTQGSRGDRPDVQSQPPRLHHYEGLNSGKLPCGWWGAYCDTTRTILIPTGLPLYARPATLLHELEHARRGDHGHQSPRVEAQINRQVAQRLVCPWDYRLAEQAHGGHPGGIAHELEQPLWVVEAYRSLAASAWRCGG